MAPAALLTILSNAVHSDPLLGATLLTALCIELDDEGWVRWASAGHPAPWLIGPDDVRQLGCTGPLPGLRPGSPLSWQSAPARPGRAAAVLDRWLAR